MPRDQTRRALVVGGAPAAEGLTDIIRREAAHAELVVAVDAGADRCLAAGVTPALVVGDMDSITSEARATLIVSGIEFVSAPSDKDESDLRIALDLLRLRGVNAVTVTGVAGGRPDHALVALGDIASASDLVDLHVEPDTRTHVLGGDDAVVEVEGAGTTFSVIAILSDAIVSVDGARWPLERARLEALSGLGLSNIVVAKNATVTVHSGVAFIVVPAPPE